MESDKKTYFILLCVSIVISLSMAFLFMYEYSRAYFLPVLLVKGVIILLFGLTAGIMTYDILQSTGERTKMWFTKLVVAFVSIVIIPPIIYDLYIPPFMILFFAIFVSSVMAVNGFILVPMNKKLAAANIMLASIVPFNAPVLFYMLYQIIHMPHIVEVAGVCHVSNVPEMGGDDRVVPKIQDFIYRERRAALRCQVPRQYT